MNLTPVLQNLYPDGSYGGQCAAWAEALAELASHSHGVTGGISGFTSGSSYGAGGGSNGVPAAITISNAGSHTAHNNLQPYIALNFIIKT